MPPMSADTARSAQPQGRRPLPRVIPAIPLRLSRPPRSARPLTPEETNTGALTHRESETEPQRASEKDPKDQTLTTIHPPLTPESKTSGPNDADGETSGQTSPQAQTLSHHNEDSVATQGLETKEQLEAARSLPSPVQAESNAGAVNGARHVAAIPTELPPPFYPADHRHAQASSGDRTGMNARPSANQALSHRTRPSVEGIVFGAAQVSPTLPSTPQELDVDTRGQNQGSLRPPPGFAPPQFAPQFYPGHSHYPSDATAAWSQPGHSVAPLPDGMYGVSQDYGQSQFPAGPDVYQNPYQGRISPGPTLTHLNGSSTSHSQSPSKTQFAELKPGSDHGDEKNGISYQNGNVPLALRMEESHVALANWLSSQFGKPTLADFVLQLRSPEAVLLSLPAHSVVVSRSPVIAEAMRRSVSTAHQSRNSPHVVDVLTSDKFLTGESLNEAVKFLYGAPLLSPPSFLFGLGPYEQDGEQNPTFQEARTRMAHALSYASAGKALQLPLLQACAAEIIHALIRWDNVDQALHYGLDGFRQASSYDANGYDTPDTASGTVLNSAIDFLAYHFPVNFQLCSSAPELRDDPRLPTLSESRTASHNPRLSKIRFGDAPPEENANPNYTSRILSSILLSLPLVLLERLFNHRATANQLGWTSVVKIMQDVIEEREKRRQRVLKNHQMSNGDAPRALVENLYYEEHVQRVDASPVHPSGQRLSTTRTSGQTRGPLGTAQHT